MTLGKICGLCSLGAFIFSIALAVGWETRDYETIHKPMAQAMWAWVQYDKCRESCERDQLAVCAKMDVPPEDCPIDCSRCDVYKEKE